MFGFCCCEPPTPTACSECSGDTPGVISLLVPSGWSSYADQIVFPGDPDAAAELPCFEHGTDCDSVAGEYGLTFVDDFSTSSTPHPEWLSVATGATCAWAYDFEPTPCDCCPVRIEFYLTGVDGGGSLTAVAAIWFKASDGIGLSGTGLSPRLFTTTIVADEFGKIDCNFVDLELTYGEDQSPFDPSCDYYGSEPIKANAV